MEGPSYASEPPNLAYNCAPDEDAAKAAMLKNGGQARYSLGAATLTITSVGAGWTQRWAIYFSGPKSFDLATLVGTNFASTALGENSGKVKMLVTPKQIEARRIG